MIVILELYLKDWLFDQEVIDLPGDTYQKFYANVNIRHAYLEHEVGLLKALWYRQLQVVEDWALVAVCQSKARPEDISDEEMIEFEKLILTRQVLKYGQKRVDLQKDQLPGCMDKV